MSSCGAGANPTECGGSKRGGKDSAFRLSFSDSDSCGSMRFLTFIELMGPACVESM